VNTEVAAGDRDGPPSLEHEDVELESPPRRCETVPRALGKSRLGPLLGRTPGWNVDNAWTAPKQASVIW